MDIFRTLVLPISSKSNEHKHPKYFYYSHHTSFLADKLDQPNPNSLGVNNFIIF
jgi:hypothetical protein